MKKEGSVLLSVVCLVACSEPFTSGFGNPTGGTGGSTTSSTTSSGGGSGGSGGTTSSGGSGGGQVGGSGGSAPVLGLTYAYPGHANNERLGISGSIEWPGGPNLVSNGSAPLLPSCIAPLTTDQSVSCDVGDYVVGTVLDIDPTGYQGNGDYLFSHCDPSNLSNPVCVGSFSVTKNGATIATCSNAALSPCSYSVNSSTNRLRFHLVLP